MTCGVGRRRSSNLALLWLWRRLAAAALILPLAWEHSHAARAALKKKKKKVFTSVPQLEESSWILPNGSTSTEFLVILPENFFFF